MSSTTENLARHTPPQVQAALDPHVPIGQLSQEVGLWLARENLVQVGEIDPEDQNRLSGRVDQVCFKVVSPFLLSPFHTGNV